MEQVLQHLQDEGQQYPERYRQLAAIRYYLHFMLSECEENWSRLVAKGVTNYKTLLDDIERWRKPGEQVCLVTFNYDRLLERDLPTVGVNIRGLSDYVANENYKVIKLHGSINWAREVETPIHDFMGRGAPSVANELIDQAAELNITQRYRLVDGRPIATLEKEQLVVFPAVALPVERKRDYECPPEHLSALDEFIPIVTKLLVIGWRATEYNFLQLLVENIQHPLRVMVVCGGSDHAQEVIVGLQRAGLNGDFIAARGGFTDLILNREADGFLGN